MSLGVNVRFLNANLLPGKTYYVVVAPRGWPAINFSLYPVRTSGSGEFNMDTDEYRSILKNTVLVEMSPEALEWAKGKVELLDARFAAEWPVWNAKDPNFKADYTLLPSDGV